MDRVVIAGKPKLMAGEPNEQGQDLTLARQIVYPPPLIADYPAVSPTAEMQDSTQLGALLAALYRRKVLVVIAASTGLLTGLAASLLTTPRYQARASVQLEGFNNDQFLHEVGPISPSLPNASPDNLLQNAVKLLESDTLANRVADKLDIHPLNQAPRLPGALPTTVQTWVRVLRPRPITAEEQRLAAVKSALTVRTSLQSQVIEIFYESLDPVLAAKGANATATEFVELNREARWQLAQDTTDWLNKQASDLKTTLEKSNQQLQEFARSAGLVFAGKQSTLAEDRMRQVQDTLAKAEADRAAKQALYTAAQANPDVLMSDPVAPGPIRQYQTELQNLRRELAQLQTMYTPSNYKVQKVQAEIRETEKSVEAERQNELAKLRTEYLAAAGFEQLVLQTQSDQLRTVEQQMENERLYDVKKTEVEATERLYEAMLEKVKEAGAASALRTTNVRIIDAAQPPSIPYSPNAMMDLAVGLGLGLVGGVALALIHAGADNKVRQPGELGLPELGVVPSVQMVESSIASGRHPAWSKCEVGEPAVPPRDQDRSLWGESFRSVLTSILFSETFRRGSEGETGRILVVTSADVMEGKTVVVTNLGIAAAETKRRVLLIDADLSRPRLHERLNVPNNRGFVDLLKTLDSGDLSGCNPVSLVQPTHKPNLWLLPSGPVDDDSSTLLYAHSSHLGAILRRLRREFDLILIDTRPLMFCADGRLLGKTSDGLVMVVRANLRSREELKSVYRNVTRDRIPVVGAILNDWKMNSGRLRSYKRYQSHYGPRGEFDTSS